MLLFMNVCNFFRACGQIFCADCSDYRAAVPDKNHFSRVRICASCYYSQTNGTTSNINSNTTTSNNQVR